MIYREYQGLKLKLFESYAEFEKVENAVMAWSDANGNELDIKTDNIDFSAGFSKEHFADNSTWVKDYFDWHAVIDIEEDKGINCIIVNEKPTTISLEEIVTTCGHELGHIIDADTFKNSTEPYETSIGYKQEETKAIAFEKFVRDSYRMALLFKEMFSEVGIEVTYSS